MQSADIGIIGGGIFGLSIAFACAGRGMAVTLHEARRLGAGASSGVIGALSPHLPENWDEKKAFQLEALMGAQAFWDEVAGLSGLPSSYRRAGRIMPLGDDLSRGRAMERIKGAQTHWQGYDWQPQWAVLDDVPWLRPSRHGYVHESFSAQIYPPLALQALADACRARGVRIVENSAVTPDEIAAEMPAKLVVIAAGHESRAMLPDHMARLAQGIKGQSARLGADLGGRAILFDEGLYVVDQGAHGVAVGSTSEAEWTDATTTDEGLEAMIAQARRMMPELADAPVIQRWAGVRPRARLPDPVIGLLSPHVMLATGGFKIGLALGPAIGQTIAAMIDGEDAGLPKRFTLAHQLALLAKSPAS